MVKINIIFKKESEVMFTLFFHDYLGNGSLFSSNVNPSPNTS